MAVGKALQLIEPPSSILKYSGMENYRRGEESSFEAFVKTSTLDTVNPFHLDSMDQFEKIFKIFKVDLF